MKNLKKKILLISTLSILFFSFLFTNYAFANVALTKTFSGSTKVTIKATGLFSGGDYSLAVHSSSASTPAYNKTLQLKADSAGMVQGDFIDLAPNGSYSAFVMIYDSTSSNVQPALATIDFTAPIAGSGSVVITTSSITQTSAIFRVSGLIPHNQYTIGVYNTDSSTPAYNQQVHFTGASNDRIISIPNLTPDGHYTAYITPFDNTSNVQPRIATVDFATLTSNITAPKITASVSEITSTSAKITVNIEQFDPSLFPIRLGLASGKTGGTVSVRSFNTENLIPTDIPHSVDITLTLDPGSDYSFRIIKLGSNAPYTDIQTFSTPATVVTTPPNNTPPDNTTTTNTYTPPAIYEPVGGLVPCGTARYKAGDVAPNGKVIPKDRPTNDQALLDTYAYLGQVKNPCDFNYALTLINNVVKFILFGLAIPLAAIMFMYAGFEMVTAGGSEEKAGKARRIFTNAVIGLALAAAAWLIVELILTTLGYDGSWIGF